MQIILILACLISSTLALINESQSQSANITFAINDFTFALFDKLRQLNERNNVFCSPLTISSIFASLMLGCRQETQLELFKTLGLDRYFQSPNLVHAHFGEVLGQIEKQLAGNRFITFNHLWIQSEMKVSDDFKGDLAKFYRGSVHDIDFQNSTGFQSINFFVSNETNGKMDKVLNSPLSSTTKLIQVNPVYFKGRWASKFNEENTRIRRFDNYDSSFSDTQFMTIRDRFGISRNKQKHYRLLEVKYENGLSLYLLVPYYKTGLQKVMRSLSLQDFLTETPSRRRYELYYPKFRIENTHMLKTVMTGLGAKRIFQSNAEMGGLSEDRSLHLADSVHHTLMENDEEGTIGEATTASDLLDKQYVPRFIINRPFLFFVRNNTNSLIYLIGWINKL